MSKKYRIPRVECSKCQKECYLMAFRRTKPREKIDIRILGCQYCPSCEIIYDLRNNQKMDVDGGKDE